MTRYQKVLWSEGLFLTPHHFQQWDRYYEDLVNSRLRGLSTLGWGVEELEINKEALQIGVFEVRQCKSVLPDGLTVNIPEVDAPPPSRNFMALFPSASERLGVYIGIPVLREADRNLAAEDDPQDSLTRYRTRIVSVPDENTGENQQPIPLAAKNLRLLFGEDSLQDHVALKIAEVRRTGDGRVALDEGFIPPVLSLSASKFLTDTVRGLFEILCAKSAILSRQRREKSEGLADFTTSDVRNFWLLHTVNSYIPLFMHFDHVQRIHPEQLYLAMARLAAALTTFVTDEGGPADLPKYFHTELTRTFTELKRKLVVLLEKAIDVRCIPIPLERTKESLYVGRILDETLLKHAQFFLGVSARMPEVQLVEDVPTISKIASLDTIPYLLRQALPGVRLSLAANPPGPVPVRLGFKYFRLEKQGPHWEAISASRSICLHFPAKFADLKLELFAVKD
jgi:type VI secretion system protein ImpJ